MNKKELKAYKKKVEMEVLENLSEGDAIEFLSEKGYKLEKPSPVKVARKIKVDTSVFKGKEEVEIAVISCTQLGNKWQQITHLKQFYQFVQDRGIKIVLHAGDLVDGEKVYTGHEYEIFLHGEKAQREYVVSEYPKMEGVTTYVIAGNHDYSFWKRSGVDIVENICKDRKDLIYCGAYGAYPKIGNLNIFLHHGDGGNAYARSYKMQKKIEQFSPETKPDIYFLGHYHTNNLLPAYRNVYGIQLGCFESQTPYLVRKGLCPEVGGWIVKFILNDKGRKSNTARFQFEYIPFFKMIENDY